MPFIGEDAVIDCAVFNLNLFSKLFEVVIAAMNMPIINIATETSIKEKAERKFDFKRRPLQNKGLGFLEALFIKND
jgi:hypothetical protein